MDTPRIRVLIADDHSVVREGLRTLLSEEAEIEIVGEAGNGEEALTLASALKPDVLLLDVVMPRMDGIEAIRQLRMAGIQCGVLVLTSFADDQKVREAIQAGAIGYLLKDVLQPELLQAIRSVAAGQPILHPEAQKQLMRQVAFPSQPLLHLDLTAREVEVLRLLAHGQSNKEIAATLGLTEGTVKGYVSSILLKLDVADRTQAALYAVKYKLVSL